jgi:hypothetical protein
VETRDLSSVLIWAAMAFPSMMLSMMGASVLVLVAVAVAVSLGASAVAGADVLEHMFKIVFDWQLLCMLLFIQASLGFVIATGEVNLVPVFEEDDTEMKARREDVDVDTDGVRVLGAVVAVVVLTGLGKAANA